MFNFYFVDNETGEDFIVEANGYHKAVAVASEYFAEPCFVRTLTDYEAEMIGVDTYQKGVSNGNYNCSRAFVRGLCPLQSRAF